MLLTYMPVARHPAVGGCSTQGQMACFLALACPGHLNTQPRWGCWAGSQDSPTSCSDRALGTRQPPVGAGPRQVTQGPAALALGLLHSWNLKCPIGLLTATAMGLCALGGRVGSPSPSFAPGGNRTKRTHTLDFSPQPQFPGLQGQPRPIFSKKPVSCSPIPNLLHSQGFYGTGLWGTGPSAP